MESTLEHTMTGDTSEDSTGRGSTVADKARRRRKMIILALILGVVAVGFYVLSIVSIIYTRGGAA